MTPFSGDLRQGLFVVALLLGCVLIAAAWVLSDARAHAKRGRPIVSSIGSVELRTPINWFCACLLVPEVALPVYVDNRAAS